MIQTIRTACAHDCPDQCSLLATVDDGRLLKLQGDPDHPMTAGFACAKVNREHEWVHSPDRVLTPLRRAGAKGEGRFEPISWAQALDLIVGRWQAIIGTDGPLGILGYAYSAHQGQLNRGLLLGLFHALGVTRLWAGTVCDSCAEAGWNAACGSVGGADPETVTESDLVISWGADLLTTNVHIWPLVERARARGAQLVVIEPRRSRTAERADWHLRVNVGTDAALALGVMHILARDGLCDRDYIARQTIGFDRLELGVLPRFDPDSVSAITGVSVADLERLAHLYGRARAPFIRMGEGMSRCVNGGQAIRAVALLPGVTGAYNRVGGGALLMTATSFGLDSTFIRKPSGPATTRIVNHSRLGKALLELGDPPIRSLFVAANNPAVTCPDSVTVRRGLAREDLFTVVHEQHLTDTTDYADIVLPATTSMEHVDLYKSFGHLYLQLAEPVIEPAGESRSNWRVVRLLARAMGLADPHCDPHFSKDEPALIREALASGDLSVAGITYERLKEERSVRLSVGRPYLPFAAGAPTPSGKVEFVSESMARAGLPLLPTYVPLVEGPENEAVARRYPLQCIVPPNRFFLNSSFSQSDKLRRRQRGASVFLHPEDARPRGISDGDAVMVRSARGEARFTATLTDDTRPGLAVIEGIWWSKHQAGGRGVNVITDDRLADMGGGPALHSNLVQVARL